MMRPRSRLSPIRLPWRPLPAGGDCAIGSSHPVAVNDDTALRSRLFSSTNLSLLAGRLAFAFLRSIVAPARAVRLPAHSDRRLMVQPGPRAVNDNVAIFFLPVQVGHCRLPRVDEQSNTGALQGCFTANAENVHRSRRR